MDAGVAWQATGIPTWATPFVGREAECSRIESLLATPECRLVTLSGPGGIGKSRLATQIARAAVAEMPVAFISAEQASDLALAIVQQLKGMQDHGDERTAQLAAYFGEDRYFLVLDNLEHLTDQATVVGDLLELCPGLRILATSREVLGLGQEWVVPVHGLAYPDDGTLEPAADFDAVRLVMARVEQASGRRPGSDELSHAVRICALTDGLPLALELAASWSRSLSLAEIADELGRGSQLLAARGRTVHARHRSFRAVIEQSWQLLSNDEQTTFARLGIFAGGFTREAAIAVTGTDVHRLTTLIDKSLVQREEDGRYRLHPLMLEFALEHLRGEADQEASLRDAHARYFLRFLQERRSEVDGGHQVAAIEAIRREWSNIGRAWDRGLECGWVEEITDAMYPIHMYTGLVGNYSDSLELARQALESFPPPGQPVRLRFHALIIVAWVNLRLGNLDEAEAAATEADEILDSRALPVPRGLNLDPAAARGTIALARGDFASAERHGEVAQRRALDVDDVGRQALALYVLENAAFEQGAYERAEHLLRQGFACSERAGDRWFSAYLHNDLGRLFVLQGNLVEAERHFEQALAIRTEFGDIGGIAQAEQHLAGIQAARGDLRQAEQRLRRCLKLYGQARDRGELARTLVALGRIALQRERQAEAAQAFADALAQAAGPALTPLMLEVLVEAARPELLGASDDGLRLLALAAGSDQAGQDVREAAEQAIAAMRSNAAAVTEARRWAARADIGAVAAAVAEALLSLARRSSASGAAATVAPAPDERLTERELEILELIAEGWSNERIGRRLGLRLGTVKWHTNQLYGKLSVGSRTEAVAAARRLGLLR